jgi:hypothetical protein
MRIEKVKNSEGYSENNSREVLKVNGNGSSPLRMKGMVSLTRPIENDFSKIHKKIKSP